MADDDQTRKSPVPGGPVPDLAGKRGGGIPDHDDGIANRELEIPHFPIRPQIGSRVPAGGTPGIFLVWSPGGPPCKHCHSRRPLRARRALNTEATCGPGGRILRAALCS